MRYTKYLLVLVLMIFVGLIKVYADDQTCYYVGDDFKARLEIYDNGKKHKVIVNKAVGKIDADSEPIMNWGRNINLVPKYRIDAYNDKQCPKYLLLDYYKRTFLIIIPVEGYNVYAIDDYGALENAKNYLENDSYHRVLSGTYLHSDGTPITRDEYNGQIIDPELPFGEDDCDPKAPDFEACLKERCGDIFGEKDDPDSLANLINLILGYVRVVVPILIIVLGSLDLAKAVVAGKEDEMKKAQKTFVKRLIVGAVIFFVPAIVNLLMWLADIVWENYNSCGIENIIN